MNALTTPVQPVQVNLTKPALMLSLAMVILTLGGFVVLISGALALARAVSGSDPLMAVIMFGMLSILVVDIFLARQLSKLIGASLTSPKSPSSFNSQRAPAQLHPTVGTPVPRMGSVTENTTRFFEPAYRSPSETDELSSKPQQ